MAVNKPEQASSEMTKVLKSIADTIDGKSNTDCAATSEISKWTKYVGNKLAENGGSSGGSGEHPNWNHNHDPFDHATHIQAVHVLSTLSTLYNRYLVAFSIVTH